MQIITPNDVEVTAMASAYESFAVQAMINYYNYDYEMFFEHLDENVIWYGPKEGQYIVGRDNLMSALRAQKKHAIFSVENVRSQLIPISSGTYSIVLCYNLICESGERTKKYLQRVSIIGRRLKDRNGNILFRCPLIQVSNVMTEKTDSAFASVQTGAQGSKNSKNEKRLAFAGENHTTVLIKESSIRYIVGGKGVCSYIHTDDGVCLVHSLLKEIAPRLSKSFYRCHSSYIVNLDSVVCFSSKGLTLNDKTQVPVSSKRYPEIKRDITDFFEQK